MSNPDDKTKSLQHRKRAEKIGLDKESGLWMAGAITTVLIAGTLFSIWTLSRTDHEMRSDLLQQAQIIAQTVNAESLKSLTGTKADLASPDYVRLKEQLSLVRKVNEKCRFIYLLGRRNTLGSPERKSGLEGGVVFSFVNNEPPDSKDYFPPGKVYDKVTKVMLRVFDTRTEGVEGPVTDRWGDTRITALEPITDPGTGKLIAVLDMDFDANDWKWEVAANSLLAAGLMITFLILLIIVARSRAIMHEELLENETKYRLVVENAQESILIVQDVTCIFANSAALETIGYSEKILTSRPFTDFIYPDDCNMVVDRHTKRLNGEEIPRVYDFRIVCQDGTIKWVELNAAVISWKGKPATLNFMSDITERKKGEEEREKLQVQLNQAQKMESVGRLAGGVAHDFNNMLSVILGHAELAMMRADPEQPLYHNLQEIRKASERSADLTRQLLAFARKQTVVPKVLDLNEAVEGMLKMLRRLIGEDIDLAWLPGKNLASVKLDPSQIDQILANLLVNARDAIAGDGKVTIETGNVTLDESYCADHAGFVPGDYVLLAVSDNGSGMDKETLANIFEPFFTTKGVGEGTGLGLSTVYGIVKQNNGFINVYSEPGYGTTFRIYLPRYTGKPVQMLTKGAESPVERGQETILLVEDDLAILNMTTSMLQQLGYTGLAASGPGEAIRLAENYIGEIHLLMTDVVMPEMNGRDLAAKLLSLHPNLKILFMSGYTADTIAHHGVLDEGVHFIQKPFSLQDLAAKMREVLNSDE